MCVCASLLGLGMDLVPSSQGLFEPCFPSKYKMLCAPDATSLARSQGLTWHLRGPSWPSCLGSGMCSSCLGCERVCGADPVLLVSTPLTHLAHITHPTKAVCPPSPLGLPSWDAGVQHVVAPQGEWEAREEAQRAPWGSRPAFCQEGRGSAMHSGPNFTTG